MQVNVPVLGFVLMDRATEVVLSAVTVFPFVSWTRICGWLAAGHAVPPVKPVGAVVLQVAAVPQQIARWLAGPDETVKALPVISARPPAPSSAVNV